MTTVPGYFWQGEQIKLRAVEPSDWETFHAWNHDTTMARGLYRVPFPQSREAAKRWAEKEATREPEGDNYFWIIEDLAGNVAGSISSHHCDPRNGTFEYGIALRKEYQGKGYASEAITLVLRYFFEELRYRKVTARVYSFNEPSIRLHERLGFQKEGQLRCMIYTEGQHFDEIIFGMTAEEFQAIDLTNRE
jgi:RimJ/RimL family protein N-acetyltransferase